MAESFVNVTEGSGKKLHSFNRTIGANSVEDEVIVHGEPYLATYVTTPGGASIATANDHILQVMAGASLHLYVRSVRIFQSTLATTAALARFQIRRLTTAGTGGSAFGAVALDSSDAAPGMTCMVIPTAKGTEGSTIIDRTCQVIQTVPTGGVGMATLLFEADFEKLRGKPLRIPAGTSNGFAVKSTIAIAAAQVFVEAIVAEANF